MSGGGPEPPGALAAAPRTRAVLRDTHAWRAALGLGTALAIGLWLRAASPATVEDLQPRPDALEYEEAARNLIAGHGYSLIVEGGRYPPRYPFGFSLLLAPLLAVWDAGPGTGVVVVLAAALATVVATWRLARDAAGPVAGAVAALLLALSPLHVRWSRAVMSDVPAACAATWLLVAIAACVRRDRGRDPESGRTRASASAARARSLVAWSAIGFGVGVSTLLRSANALVLLPAVLGALLAGPAARTRRLAALAAGALVGLVPLLAYNRAVFGSPLRSGYDVWVGGDFFVAKYALGPLAGGGTAPNAVVYGRAVAGLGDLYPWPVALLIVVGAITALRGGGDRALLARLAAALALSTIALHLVFFWQDTRFLLIALPPLLAVAALPLARPIRPAPCAAAALLLAVALALLLRTSTTPAYERRASEPALLRALDAALPSDAAVLVRSSEALVRRYLRRPGTDRVWVPIGRDPHQLVVRVARLAPHGPPVDDGAWIRQGLSEASAVQTVRALLAEGRPVYLSTMHARQVKRFRQLVLVLQQAFPFEPTAQSIAVRLRDVRPVEVAPTATDPRRRG